VDGGRACMDGSERRSYATDGAAAGPPPLYNRASHTTEGTGRWTTRCDDDDGNDGDGDDDDGGDGDDNQGALPCP